jgi:hypothetical protein
MASARFAEMVSDNSRLARHIEVAKIAEAACDSNHPDSPGTAGKFHGAAQLSTHPGKPEPPAVFEVVAHSPPMRKR